jgi:hypothetical protein
VADDTMNTLIEYLYRDAANNKQWHEVVIAGQLDEGAMRKLLWEGEYFLPSVLELPALQERFAAQGYKYPSPDDHPWHELVKVAETTNRPTHPLTASEIVGHLNNASARGWETLAAKWTAYQSDHLSSRNPAVLQGVLQESRQAMNS